MLNTDYYFDDIRIFRDKYKNNNYYHIDIIKTR